MSVELSELVQTQLARHPCAGERWLGYSGGLDSTVLLHLLAGLRIPLRAMHIHHGLSPNADTWLAHCVETARALGIPFSAIRVTVDPRDGGLEQAARRARYAAFGGLLGEGDQLLLAQHGDDQVETFLLRLLRGAGALGLAGMAQSRPLGSGSLLRPLLGAGRAQLEDYANVHGLRWMEDESNADLCLERNYLRARVLPPLRERWPVRERIARACANLRETAGLLQELGQRDLADCAWRRERFGESLDLAGFAQLSLARQNNLLRSWLNIDGDTPQALHLEQLRQQMLTADADRQPQVRIAGREARRFRGRLYITPPLAMLPGEGEWEWDGRGVLELPGGWQLKPSPGWPAGRYRVRFRRGGERAKPLGRAHSQTLKKLLQELALEPWLRDSVPLVYDVAGAIEGGEEGGQLLAAGDLFVCSERLPGPPEWRYHGACSAAGSAIGD